SGTFIKVDYVTSSVVWTWTPTGGSPSSQTIQGENRTRNPQSGIMDLSSGTPVMTVTDDGSTVIEQVWKDTKNFVIGFGDGLLGGKMVSEAVVYWFGASAG